MPVLREYIMEKHIADDIVRCFIFFVLFTGFCKSVLRLVKLYGHSILIKFDN